MHTHIKISGSFTMFGASNIQKHQRAFDKSIKKHFWLEDNRKSVHAYLHTYTYFHVYAYVHDYANIHVYVHTCTCAYNIDIKVLLTFFHQIQINSEVQHLAMNNVGELVTMRTRRVNKG